jgi:uncharacterized protein
LRSGAGAAASDLPCFAQAHGPDLLLLLSVQPRATPEGPAGIHADRLRLRVGAAPVDDSANARVVSLLADLLDLPRGAIRIVRGHHSRNKDVLVRDVGAARARIALIAGRCAPSGHAQDTRTAPGQSARTRKR